MNGAAGKVPEGSAAGEPEHPAAARSVPIRAKRSRVELMWARVSCPPPLRQCDMLSQAFPSRDRAGASRRDKPRQRDAAGATDRTLYTLESLAEHFWRRWSWQSESLFSS